MKPKPMKDPNVNLGSSTVVRIVDSGEDDPGFVRRPGEFAPTDDGHEPRAELSPAAVADPEPSPPAGIWLIYDWDNGPYVISIHPTCEAAASASAGTGYGRIGFVAFDVPFHDAIKAWEGR